MSGPVRRNKKPSAVGDTSMAGFEPKEKLSVAPEEVADATVAMQEG